MLTNTLAQTKGDNHIYTMQTTSGANGPWKWLQRFTHGQSYTPPGGLFGFLIEVRDVPRSQIKTQPVAFTDIPRAEMQALQAPGKRLFASAPVRGVEGVASEGQVAW